MPPLAREILDFWFGPLPHAARAEWFRKDPAFDASIAARFGAAIEAALSGAFRDWHSEARAALARVLLLDQFTRNAFRDTPRAFAGDAEALATAIAIVDAGLDRALDAFRALVSLPAVRARRGSGDAAALARAVHATRGRHRRSHPARVGRRSMRPSCAASAAIRIATRSSAAPSTPEEIAFLQEPGSRF